MNPLMTCVYSIEETKKFAEKVYEYIISENIKIVYMKGDMGSGKTSFVKTIIESLDPKYTVNSPTYSYVNEYNINEKYIWHFDLYRIESKGYAENLGILDYLHRDDGIAFIEWPEKINRENLKLYKSLILHFFHIKNPHERACIVVS